MTYERLEAELEKPSKAADHRATWDALKPLLTVDQAVRDRVEVFARSKRISLEALVAMNTRVKLDRHGGVELAWGYLHRNGVGEIVSAVKYRPLDASKKRYAEPRSVFVTPLVLGRRDSLDWFVAEGETDAARLYELVGGDAAVLVLPAGALAFKQSWASVIPRGATVHLCHDADEAGDQGAAKAAKVIGGRTVRVRPPLEGGDWCDWPGGRDEFIRLVGEARQGDDVPFALPLDEFVALTIDAPEALIGDESEPILPRAGLLIEFAKGGKGKTTLTIEAAFHLVSAVEWLGFAVARPLNVLFVENEGPREPFRKKLEIKRKLWPHPITGSLHVCVFNWGAVTLKDSSHVARLRDYITENQIDVVIGDPLDSLGLEGVGSPEDTREFMRLLSETGLFRDVAWWLLAHARKEPTGDELDAISGAWGGRPDTMLMLEKRDGNRARLAFPKIRWSRRGTRNAYILAFDPDTESFTVAGEESGDERDYLAEILELLADDAWKTVNEIAAPEDDGGIGANAKHVKKILESNPDRFDSRTGKAAKEVGRHPSSTVWKLSQGFNSPDSPSESFGDEGEGELVSQPYRTHQPLTHPTLTLGSSVDSPTQPTQLEVAEES